MQLILTHADLELALIESLRSKGMTAFEPGKASVDFSFKRGTRELQCILDTEPKAEAPVTVKPTPAAEGSGTTVVEPVTQEPVAAPTETGQVVAEGVARDEGAGTAGAEDNLFD